MATGAADEELHGALIVGGGICGIGTALALHIKGINRLLVLEKGESLRATGAGISIQANGWRALDQLKVGDELRKLALPLTGMEKKSAIHGDKILEISYRTECRCLKRSDLVETLARSLPEGSIRFGCQVDAISLDTVTRWPIVSTSNGATIRAKVVIGCDGSNSVVAKFLGLRSLRLLPMWAARGLTTIPQGHGLGNRFQQLMAEGVSFRLTPIDDKTLHFNAVHFRPPNPKEYTSHHRDPMLIRQLALKAMPDDVAAVVRRCDTASLSLAQLCYRAPWHMLLQPFQAGTVTVAGDAMHAMGPFIGQGGSCSLEDAIVLARCLAPTVAAGDQRLPNEGCIEEAIASYVQQRRGRILRLSLQSFLNGQLIAASSWLNKVLIKAAMAVFFRGNSHGHTDYDCGSL